MTGFASLPVAESGPSNAHLTGQSKILGPSWLRIPSLTVGLLGVRVLWSVEMSYASPYLLQLGLSKSWMAMVFLAGPLSGLIVQPVIGVLADGSTSRWGRRRPYMLGGVVLCMLSMLLLGYTRPIAGWFTRLGTNSNDTLTIGLAVLSIYSIDFSINAVQAVNRALIIDTLPSTQQASGNAWASRMMGVGGIAGFFIGSIDLPHFLPFLGSQQLGALSAIAALLLFGTQALTAVLVKEKVLIRGDPTSRGFWKTGLKGGFLAMWTSMWTLPRVIRKIFIIQFFTWLGWFPVLFYTTVYVGDIYKRTAPPSVPRDAAFDAEATRLGTQALLCSAVVCLAGNVLLPFCISSRNSRQYSGRTRGGWGAGWKMHLATMWAISHLVFACCMGATFFISTVWGATALVAVTGMAWAVTLWAPFSLLGEAILSEPSSEHGSIIVADARHARHRMSGEEEEEEGERERFLVVIADDEDEEHSDDDDERKRGRLGMMGNSSAQLSMLDMHAAAGEEYQIHDQPGPSGNDLSAKAGIILGIHNICIVIPQLLITCLSSIIFALFDPTKSVLHGKPPGSVAGNGTVIAKSMEMDSGTENLFLRSEEGGEAAGVDSVAIIFRLGGIAAAIAFVLSLRLARELKYR
ncbi:MFS general substrate transporter, partial [Athelia psychrophila]